MSVVKSSTCEN
jgi:hypothetical protein